jgi:hypothetical protein
MKLTAVELTIERDCVSEHEVGDTAIFLLGEDNEWHTFTPGTVIEVDDENLRVVNSSEDSPYGDME